MLRNQRYISPNSLVVNSTEAETVRSIFKRYFELGSDLSVSRELNVRGITRKSWTTKKGITRSGNPGIARISTGY